ncbi:hypothetical protein SBA2_10009 [Acidobacteriia bacterium SbA2]|nr:hypothetical protein SBA2_10009 [Acidobacteriia bacterium SbA2]
MGPIALDLPYRRIGAAVSQFEFVAPSVWLEKRYQTVSSAVSPRLQHKFLQASADRKVVFLKRRKRNADDTRRSD